MQTVLITGSKGQLGNEMQRIATHYPAFNFIYTDVDELDITNKSDIERFVKNNQVHFIINCAAYTAVDAAEDNAELCYRINRDAIQYLGEVAAQQGIKIVHISTDYVFDGKNYVPYTEEMPVSPTSVYGKSKLAGEQALAATCPEAVIVRTSWLYSSFGNNFVKTMIRLGKERDAINVIFDQVGTPTYAADLAKAIMHIVASDRWTPGTYHFSNEGVCSWYDFTKTIHRLYGGIECKVSPIETKDYPVRTPRPFYSVLNKAKIKATYAMEIPYWEESLAKCIDLLRGEN